MFPNPQNPGVISLESRRVYTIQIYEILVECNFFSRRKY